MEKDVLGYAIVRGSNSLLIYNHISELWVKKPDENLFFNSLSEAQKAFNKIRTFKNTAGIMTVTRFEGHCLIFNKIRKDYE
ncbi:MULTISPECIES: hypothetical protein [Providencia]|uniref:hypothetical protein n=1 Tax=Providencia TaxID=586 RepID=UPI00065DF9D1|nr:hypothetical protein [Providencia rettgeri]